MTAPPTSAMVLAAGLGTRMGGLTHDRPKALVTVAGRPLIDHALDKLAAAVIGEAVVNLHHHANLLEAHLARRLGPPRLALSDERAQLMDTGGGVAQALPLIAGDPFYVVNVDCLWRDGPVAALARLAAAWADDAMDALLLVVPRGRAEGHGGRGDFFMEGSGRLTRRGDATTAPYVFSGLRLAARRLFDDCPAGPFSFNLLFDRAIVAGRLYGLVHDGAWFDVGTLAAREAAEHLLSDGPS